jgi:hypothetical protein
MDIRTLRALRHTASEAAVANRNDDAAGAGEDREETQGWPTEMMTLRARVRTGRRRRGG